MDPECVEVERRAFRRDLLEALVVDVVGEEQRARPLGDRRRLVVGGVADAAAEPGGLVAVGGVGERGADIAAADAGDCVGKGWARQRIGVIADIGTSTAGCRWRRTRRSSPARTVLGDASMLWELASQGVPRSQELVSVRRPPAARPALRKRSVGGGKD